MTKPELLFLPNREVRAIPAGWQHPRDADGRFVPLFREDMPNAAGESDIMAYETTSEGTPISPGFPNSPEGRLALVRYCAKHCFTFGDHRADEEAWAAILFGEDAVVTENRDLYRRDWQVVDGILMGDEAFYTIYPNGRTTFHLNLRDHGTLIRTGR